MLKIAASRRKETRWFDVTSIAIDIRRREKRMSFSEEFRP